MHPAASIIFFTTVAGAGYGLLFLLGLAAPFGLLPSEPWLGLSALGPALAFVSVGLLSSTFHLRRPERAWRAMSQWRSSWLSREAVAALATYLPAGLFAAGWVFLGATGGFWGLCGLLAALGAVVTVVCTAMVYASLKPVRQWHNGWVVPAYLGFAFMTGALWLTGIAFLGGASAPWTAPVALLALACAWVLKLGYWRAIDHGAPVATPESATGLGHLGTVRLLDPPHTGENYLLREMGFRVARKHAAKLRRHAVLLGLVVPSLGLALALGLAGWPGTLAALVAAASGTLGVAIERWLFFAEATHTVTLYYGRRGA